MCYFKFVHSSTQTTYSLLYRYLFEGCYLGPIMGSTKIVNIIIMIIIIKIIRIIRIILIRIILSFDIAPFLHKHSLRCVTFHCQDIQYTIYLRLTLALSSAEVRNSCRSSTIRRTAWRPEWQVLCVPASKSHPECTDGKDSSREDQTHLCRDKTHMRNQLIKGIHSSSMGLALRQP